MLEIRGHFDGTQILLDEPCELPPNTKVIIKVLQDDEETDWLLIGKKSFARCYADNDPEYPLEKIKTLNPEYEGN